MNSGLKINHKINQQTMCDLLVQEGRIGISCDDFKPGTILWLDGNFDDDIQRLSFAMEITLRLQASK